MEPESFKLVGLVAEPVPVPVPVVPEVPVEGVVVEPEFMPPVVPVVPTVPVVPVVSVPVVELVGLVWVGVEIVPVVEPLFDPAPVPLSLPEVVSATCWLGS